LGSPSTSDGSKASILKSPLSSLPLMSPYELTSAGPQGLPPKRLGLLPP
jgi:hypothetical protein